jgi:hypothetical protein
VPEPVSDDAPDDERPDDVSLLKKLERDDHDPPWPPPADDPGAQVAAVCAMAGADIPGDGDEQFSRGINA